MTMQCIDTLLGQLPPSCHPLATPMLIDYYSLLAAASSRSKQREVPVCVFAPNISL